MHHVRQSTPFQIEGLDSVAWLDFKGRIRERVEATSSSGLAGVSVKVVGFEVSATDADLGLVTISQRDGAAAPGEVVLIRDAPRAYRHTVRVNVGLSIETPPGGGEPLLLHSIQALTYLHPSVRFYPPRGDTYQIAEPLEFALPDNPGRVLATLERYSVAVGGA